MTSYRDALNTQRAERSFMHEIRIADEEAAHAVAFIFLGIGISSIILGDLGDGASGRVIPFTPTTREDWLKCLVALMAGADAGGNRIDWPLPPVGRIDNGPFGDTRSCSAIVLLRNVTEEEFDHARRQATEMGKSDDFRRCKKALAEAVLFRSVMTGDEAEEIVRRAR